MVSVAMRLCSLILRWCKPLIPFCPSHIHLNENALTVPASGSLRRGSGHFIYQMLLQPKNRDLISKNLALLNFGIWDFSKDFFFLSLTMKEVERSRFYSSNCILSPSIHMDARTSPFSFRQIQISRNQNLKLCYHFSCLLK